MRTIRHLACWIVLSSFLLIQGSVSAETSNWPRFRGALGTGVATGNLPQELNKNSIAWSTELSGFDVGSASIADGRVYFLESVANDSSEGKRSQTLHCLTLSSGESIWNKSFPQGAFKTHSRNTMAASTPTVDNGNVYVAWQDSDRIKMAMINESGDEVWQRDLGTWQSSHGFATSPAIVDEMVVLLNSQQADELEPGQVPADSHLVAFNKMTGENVWQTPLVSNRVSYGMPAVARDQAGKPTAIIAATTGNGLFAVDPSDGKMLWEIPVFDKRSCSSTLLHRTKDGVDVVIGSCGSGGGGNSLSAIRLSNSGATAMPSLAYQIKKSAPYVPTPVIVDDEMITIDDRGIALSIDVASGDVKTTRRVGGNFGASPIVAGRECLVVDLKGKATVLSVDDLKEIRSFDLGGPVGATPAFVDGNLLIRVGDRMICYRDPS